MKVYVLLRKYDNIFNYDYCSVSATLDKAKESLQEIINDFYGSNNHNLESYEEQDYSTYWVYIIDGMQFEIWEEVI